jgi:SOS-response transcriptional repressor LexA
MLKDVLERIETRLAETGVTARAASISAGLGSDYIRDLRRAVDGRDPRRSGVGAQQAVALARTLGVSVAWLLTGHEDPVFQTQFVVPLVSWVAAGQPATGMDDPGDWPMIETAPLPKGQWVALEVRGDSMDRVAADGSIIFVNLKDKAPVDRGLYVFGIGNETTFKQWRNGRSSQIAPMSTNPDHLSMMFPENGRIIGRVRRVTKDW